MTNFSDYDKARSLFQDAYAGDRVACVAIVKLLQERCGVEDVGARAMKILEELSPGGVNLFKIQNGAEMRSGEGLRWRQR